MFKRTQLENYLIREEKIDRKDLSYTKNDGFDITILRKDDITTMFFFKKDTVIISMTKEIKNNLDTDRFRR